MNSKKDKSHYRGCLIGGAIGDALGWPVEFARYNDIINKYGSGGISKLVIASNGKAEVTDDTQMTIFTAEGLLRANAGIMADGECDIVPYVHKAYLRWLYTQGTFRCKEEQKGILKSWLLDIKELFAVRAPGNSCLSALRSGETGTIDRPINNSKGCGGIMRAAPAGLAFGRDRAFQAGCECAVITHGHPSGYISAGILAHIIAGIIEGMEIEEAAEGALKKAGEYKVHEECTEAAGKALKLAKTDIEPLVAIRELGEGWVGEEALAISLYCAVKYKDNFRQALVAAVNHDGDSDSTGAITGNILGAYLGMEGIPKEWVGQVELVDVLTQLADDLVVGYMDSEE